ncbi:MAG: 2-phospho-L-lactate transferase [Candidatus Freyarchaeota archaeon]|nr:2-phospho-L-lactate transferase [Candidatus Jordarchaeia archaeon]MBS7269074.1 2-phospho-L-lactate transferase [Candidatus Jordarchaeia archaeon]MBS7279902.1 2-phospho-L-lactate transferase [Candidatus Jordarchaeia archaeon]
MITVLSGGTGSLKLTQGFLNFMKPEEVTLIVNTADDFEWQGLYISPDIDTAIYLLAGLLDENRFWGIKGDTFHFLSMMKRYGYPDWFSIGDRDLATHLHRTILLKKGYPLSDATASLCKAFNIRVKILPMSNDKVTTFVKTDKGKFHFQEFWVKRKGEDKVLDVILDGIEKAKPAPGVVESIKKAEGIIIGPSNPVTSIGPILGVSKIKKALEEVKVKRICISPIIGGGPVSGPAGNLLRGIGVEVSPFGVASIYQGIIDEIFIDASDQAFTERIEDLGISVFCTNIIMRSEEDKVNLAKLVMERMKI